MLETRVVSERIEHRIEPEERGSERRLAAAERAFVGKGESTFCRAAMARSGSPDLRRYARENFDRSRAVEGIFLDRHRGHGALGKTERGFLVAEAHRGQGEIEEEIVIFRLFLEERLQFGAGRAPARLRAGVVARHFLRPA